MNSLVSEIRKRSGDRYADKTDDEITLSIGQRHPELLEKYPDLQADFAKLTAPKEEPGVVDTLREGLSEAVKDSSLPLAGLDPQSRAFAQVGTGVIRGGLNLAGQAANLLRSPAGVAVPYLGQIRAAMIGSGRKEATPDEEFFGDIAEGAATASKKIAEVTKPSLGSGLGNLPGALSEGAVSTIPSLIAARFGGIKAAAGAAALQSAADTYGEALEKYKGDRTKASQAALLSGATTGVLTRYLGGAEKFISNLTSGKLVIDSAKKLLGEALKSSGFEFFEEGLDTLLQDIRRLKTYQPDLTAEKIIANVATSATLGGGLGFLMSGAAGIGLSSRAGPATPEATEIPQPQVDVQPGAPNEIPSTQVEAQVQEEVGQGEVLPGQVTTADPKLFPPTVDITDNAPTGLTPQAIDGLGRQQLLDVLTESGVTKVGTRFLRSAKTIDLRNELKSRVASEPQNLVDEETVDVPAAPAAPAPVGPSPRSSIRDLAPRRDVRLAEASREGQTGLREFVARKDRGARAAQVPIPQRGKPRSAIYAPGEVAVNQAEAAPEQLEDLEPYLIGLSTSPGVTPQQGTLLTSLAGFASKHKISPRLNLRSPTSHYNTTAHTVGLRPEAPPRTAIHETVHALSSRFIEKYVLKYEGRVDATRIGQLTREAANNATIPAEAREISRLYLKAVEAKGLTEKLFGPDGLAGVGELSALVTQNGIDYGFSNPHEFIGQAWSSPEFRSILESIPSGDGKKSIWDKILDILKKLFPFLGEPSNQSLLTDVLGASERVFQRDVSQDVPAGGSIAFSLQSALKQLEETRARAAAGPTTESVTQAANAQRNVRIEQASEVVGGMANVQQNVVDLQNIVAQRNTKGDIRLTGEALQQMKVMQAILGNPVIYKLFVAPVTNLMKSVQLMGGATNTYEELTKDPNATPAMKSAAAGAAVHNFDAFYAKVHRIRRSYDSTVAGIKAKLAKAIKDQEQAVGATQLLTALHDDLIEIARGMMLASNDKAALAAYRRQISNRASNKNVIAFVAGNIDMSNVGPGKLHDSAGKLATHILAIASAKSAPGATPEMTIRASREVVTDMARFIINSQAAMTRITDTSLLVSGKAATPPLSRFKAALAEAIRKQEFGRALKLFASGVGNTATERDATRKAASLALRRQQNFLVQLQAMEGVRDMIDGVERSPEFRAASKAIYGELGVKEVVQGIKGTDWVMHPIYAGDKEVVLPKGLNRSVSDLKLLKDFSERAMSYITDHNHPDWDPVKVAGLQAFLVNEGIELNPVINPGVDKFSDSWAKVPYDWIGNLILRGNQAVAKFILSNLGGHAAEKVAQRVSAYDAAKIAQISLARRYTAELGIPLKAALRSHGIGQDAEAWYDSVFVPLSASLQSFSNPVQLRVGSKIGNGMTVTQADMDYFLKLRSFEKEAEDIMNGIGDKAFRVTGTLPGGISYDRDGKKAFRLHYERGPGTVSRKLTSMFQWHALWKSATTAKRVEFLNENLERILQGYVWDVTNPDLKKTYKFESALKDIANDRDNPVTSFQDLATRIFDLQDEGTGEVFTRDEIAAQIINEIDESFTRWKTFHDDREANDKSIMLPWGGRNSFNTERGEQIVPSRWYDYGSVTLGQRLAFLHNMTVGPMVELWNALQVVQAEMAVLVAQYDKGTQDKGIIAAQSETRRAQLAGEEFYNGGEARRMQKNLAVFIGNLEDVFKAQAGHPLMGTAADQELAGMFSYTIGTLLASPVVQSNNMFGGTIQSMLFDGVVRNRSYAVNFAVKSKQLVKGLTREIANIAAKSQGIRGGLVNLQTAPLVGAIADFLVDYMDSTQELFQKSQIAGLNSNVDLLKILQTQWEFWRSGGVPGRVSTNPVAIPFRVLQTLTRNSAEILRQASTGYFDARINQNAWETMAALEQDMMDRAIKFGEGRAKRAAVEGRRPDDVTELRNRFSDNELVGGRLKNPTVGATKLRQFFLRDASINIDQEMWKFYNDWVAAGKPEQGDFPEKLRMFKDPQTVNQMLLAISKSYNLATPSTSPIGLQKGPGSAAVGIFFRYPGWLNYQLMSITDDLSLRPYPKAFIDNLPNIIGTATALTLMGAAGLYVGEELRRLFFKRFSPFPHVLEKQTTESRVKSIIGGFSSNAGALGSIANMVTGRVYKRGFDINNMILPINLSSDFVGTTREMFQSGYILVPWTRFGGRWVFPVNYLYSRLPITSGLNEISQVRNLLAKGGRQIGLEVKTGGGASSQGRTFTEATGGANEFMNAIGNRDRPAADKAFKDLQAHFKDIGSRDPTGSAIRAVMGRNPVIQVFENRLTEDEYLRVLNSLPDEQKAKVQELLSFYQITVERLSPTSNKPRFFEAPPRIPIPGGSLRNEFAPADPTGGSLRDEFSRPRAP